VKYPTVVNKQTKNDDGYTIWQLKNNKLLHMKKIYLSILSLLAVYTASAQLTQANHAPADLDTYSMYQCDTVSPGPSGAGATWNFSAITTHSSILNNYVVQSVTSATYPSANVAVASSSNDAAYYESASAYLNYFGGNISVGPVAGALTYTAAAISAAYPMSLNTTSSAVTGGSMNITAPLATTGSFTGTSTVLVDGSGTISLPGAVTLSNTLRVVTSQTMDIVTSIANVTVTQINYNYYEAGIKAPVFSISTSTAVIGGFLGSTTSQTFVTRNKNVSSAPTNTGTVSLTENKADAINFSVFPNPSTTSVNFVASSADAKLVSIYDITGKVIDKQNLVDGKSKVDVSSYMKGLYLYTISSSDNRILKSGKITVSQ
jgi:hypothetical protein